MKLADVRRKASAMPLVNPSYPPGPYRFYNREYLVIAYRTDPDALREVVPEPLETAMATWRPRRRSADRRHRRSRGGEPQRSSPGRLPIYDRAIASIISAPDLTVIAGPTAASSTGGKSAASLGSTTTMPLPQ